MTISDYSYNGKELNEDFGLNLHDYGARWYDASVGRWWSVDPLGEVYVSWSGYNYVMGNPLRLFDPNGMAPDDYVYLDTKGNEIGRVKDNKVKQVTIIADENLDAFHMLSEDLKDQATSIAAASTMGKTYDMTPMLEFYNDNRKDYYDNSQPTFKNASDGKAPKDIPVVRAIPLYEKNGVVTIGKNEPVSNGGERVVGENPGQISKDKLNEVKKTGQTGFLHTEPVNERNSKYLMGGNGSYSTKGYHPNPSYFDAEYYKPSASFHSVIIRPKEAVFLQPNPIIL